jgi:hypothetical protein
MLLGLTDCKYGGQRVERGVFNVLGEISKIHFGTIDCDDAHCYSEQIERFCAKLRNCGRPFEATIVGSKIVIRTVNSSLSDVDCNGAEVRKGLLEVKGGI